MKTLTRRLVICVFAVFAAGCDNKANIPEPIAKKYLKLGFTEKLVSNSAGQFEVYVSSNTDWTVEPLSDWLKPATLEGTGNVSLKVQYDASSVSKRTGIIRFRAEGLNPVDFTVTQTEATFTNPIFQMPDPWVVRHEDKQGKVWYYACKAQGAGVNLSRSDKLSVINGTSSAWKCPADNASKPWNVAELWAPELHYVDGAWYIYYAAGRPQSESGGYSKQRTGVLRNTSDNPMTGTWQDMGMLYTGDNYTPGIKPTVDNTAYAIDMGVFKLNGQLYAVWSGNPVGSGDQYLYIAKMDNPYTISSSRVEISRPDKAWELYSGKVNEGPAFLHNEEAGKFFVVYSCNGSWTNKYRLGMLTLDTSKDPMVKANWTKSANEVFYRFDNTPDGTNGVNGCGHCSFAKSPDGTEDWIIYHVNHSKDSGWSQRQAFIQKFTWNKDGSPNFGTPVGWGEPIPIPAGETPAQ